MEVLPQVPPAATPEAVTAAGEEQRARELLAVYLDLQRSKGGRWLVARLEDQRDGFAERVLNDDQLGDREREQQRSAFRAFKSALDTMEDLFQEALHTLLRLNKLDPGYLPLIKRLPETVEEPTRSAEELNPFGQRSAALDPLEPPHPEL